MHSKITGAIAAIILVILICLGWYAYKHPVSTPDEMGTVGSVATSTIIVSTSTVPVVVHTSTETVVNPFPGGTTYHNGVYGLTLALPAGYTYAEAVSSFENYPDSDSIIFSQNGVRVFQINVFTKAQWNAIRTQENLAHQNINDLGEGNYYGENTTYIYSSTIYTNTNEVQTILRDGRFY